MTVNCLTDATVGRARNERVLGPVAVNNLDSRHSPQNDQTKIRVDTMKVNFGFLKMT